MSSVFLIYKTDNHHSFGSQDVIGIATSKRIALILCKRKARMEHHKIDGDQLYNLENLNQTQGYEGEGEFVINHVSKNTLI